jgi:hypothetical protein
VNLRATPAHRADGHDRLTEGMICRSELWPLVDGDIDIG